jgi:hypothetical protein
MFLDPDGHAAAISIPEPRRTQRIRERVNAI